MKNEKRVHLPTILLITAVSVLIAIGFSYFKTGNLSAFPDGCYIISIILISYSIIDLWAPTPLSKPKDVLRGLRQEPIRNGKADLNTLFATFILLIIATIAELV